MVKDDKNYWDAAASTLEGHAHSTMVHSSYAPGYTPYPRVENVRELKLKESLWKKKEKKRKYVKMSEREGEQFQNVIAIVDIREW